MAQKQGGKGKQSSQSDKNYWARLKAAGGVSRRKAKNIAAAGKRKQGIIDYGRKPAGKPVERVVFSGTVRENFPAYAADGIFPHFVILDGKTVDVLPRETDALASFSGRASRLPGMVARVGGVASEILAVSLC